jgi:hypothetical protein
MKLNINKLEEICKKYGYYIKNEMADSVDWSYPGINANDYALRSDIFGGIYCAVDVRDTTDGFNAGWATSRIGFYNEERMYSYKKIKERLKFLKKRIIELQREMKLENIEKDF